MEDNTVTTGNAVEIISSQCPDCNGNKCTNCSYDGWVWVIK